MAGPPKRANKRPPAKRSSAPVPQHIDVSVRGALTSKLEPWRPLITWLVAFIAVVTGLIAFWNWGKFPTLVLDRTLQESVTDVEAKLRKHIGETKVEVIDHSNKNTKEVKEDVGLLAKTLSVITRKQDQSDVRALEGQQRLLFVQRQNVLNSLSSLEVQLAAKPADPFLTQRKGELESIKGNLDREFDAVAADLRRARAQ